MIDEEKIKYKKEIDKEIEEEIKKNVNNIIKMIENIYNVSIGVNDKEENKKIIKELNKIERIIYLTKDQINYNSHNL